MSKHEGGCLCGAVRFSVSSEPVRVTFCHCDFCQRSTGSAYAVEPIFSRSDVEITRGATAEYAHRSSESGKMLAVNFCRDCGTKIYLDFERFPDVRGVYGGTFDDPGWFDRSPQVARHIFLESAQRGTIIPANMPTYEKHATRNDGTPADPVVFEIPYTVK